MSMRRFVHYVLIASVLSLAGWPASACDVPVYRYALEHWNPDAYQATILHQGAMGADSQALIALLEKQARETPYANLVVQTIDADHPANDAERTLCQGSPCGDGPRLVVRFPSAARIQGVAWEGRLTADAVAAVTDSPCRRDVAHRLLAGDAVVWVLLESGRKDQDDAAAERIAAELKQSPDEAQSPITSSLVRVSRTDPAEKLLTETLLSTELDLRGRDEPMAFPVFGRGRVLYALVGAGIGADTVRHALTFLTSGCSCTIKRGNPGVDLLLTADWSTITPTTPEETAPPDAPAAETVPLTPLTTSKTSKVAQPAAEAEEGPVAPYRMWLFGAIGGVAVVTTAAGWVALRSRKAMKQDS
jgi:hypothetical protein